jgi:protein TonB
MTELADSGPGAVRPPSRPRPIGARRAAASSVAPDAREPLLPLAAVMGLGERATRVGAVLGLVVGLATHGTASVDAMRSLPEMRRAVRQMREGLHEFFWAMYDVEVEKPAPKPDEPKPPEPPPEPDPAPAPKLAEPAKAEKAQKEDPYDQPPPPSQAAKVLTAPSKDDEPEDLTKAGFVTGDGTGPGYGRVSAAGTGTAATWNPKASNTGTPGGTGTGTAPPPAPVGPDLSKAPGLVGSTSWNCSFPAEADADQIDQATVSILVTVRPDGTPSSVKVLSDPGHGFGRAARTCALGRGYTAGLDRGGNPITATTPPITVRFTR